MIDDDRLLGWSGLMVAGLALIGRRVLRVGRRGMSTTLSVRLISWRRWIVRRWWTLIAIAQLRIIILRCLSWRGSLSCPGRRFSLLVPRCTYQRHIDHQNHADRNKKLQRLLLLHFKAKSFLFLSHQIIIYHKKKRYFNSRRALELNCCEFMA